MSIEIGSITTDEIIKLYPKILKELKKRGIIKTKNLIGELGEYLAIKHYNQNPKFPNLSLAEATTKNIDAGSRDGERYSIKSVSGTSTGVFHGLEKPDSTKSDKQIFEYVIIVIFDDNYELDSILEINWEQFLEIKKWHTTMQAWNIPINTSLKKMSKNIFLRES